jgi:hypothetical protein
MGTHLERGQKQKQKNPSPRPQKEKNWTPNDCMLSLLVGCMKVYSQNCLSPFLTWANGKGINCVGHSIVCASY